MEKQMGMGMDFNIKLAIWRWGMEIEMGMEILR